MVHPDHETRVGAHRVFSVVLVPSSVCPHSPVSVSESDNLATFSRTLSRTVSVFSSSAALFEKLRKEKSSSRRYIILENKENVSSEGEQKKTSGFLERIRSSYSRASTSSDPDGPPTQDEDSTDNIFKTVVDYRTFFTILNQSSLLLEFDGVDMILRLANQSSITTLSII